MRADWARLLDAPDAPDFLNLAAEAGAQLVKSNDGRQVWRVQRGCDLLYVKVCRPARRWAATRRFLFGCDASRERGVAEYAAARRIETVVPVAVATAPIQHREPISILVTVGLPRAVPLNEFWAQLDTPDSRACRLREEMIDATARLIAGAHQNGFEHSDLHAGNVLIEPNGTSGWRALFVDLLNVKTGKAVSRTSVVRNLAQFNQWFRLHATLTDRVRFLKRYLAWRDRLQAAGTHGRSLPHDWRALLPELDRAAHEHANSLYGKRDRRAMRTGRYFASLRLAHGWAAHVFLEAKHPVDGSVASGIQLTAARWKQWLADPEAWCCGTHRQYIIKDSPTALVYRAQLSGEGETPIDVVCKRSIPRNWIKRVALWVRPSRPMLTWKLANALLNRQVPTARALAVAERRVFGRPVDAFIITEHIEHAHDLDALLAVQLRDMSDAQARMLKTGLTRSLAATLRRLHERGFTHRDLKASNLIVQWNPEALAPPRVLLVDLDGVRQGGRSERTAELRGLARLNVSLDHCRHVTLADRLRFLKRYLVRPGCPEPDWRSAWKQIEQLSARKRWEKEPA